MTVAAHYASCVAGNRGGVNEFIESLILAEFYSLIIHRNTVT